jgi:hypothetical protein
MIYSILLIFEKRDTLNDKNNPRWGDCVTKLANIAEQNKDIQLLGENVLLLPLQNNLRGIYDAVRSLGGLPYKYTILTEELQWHEVSNPT